MPHRHLEEPWFDEDLEPPREGFPIRAVATVVGVVAVTLVMGIGLWVRHGHAELGATAPPEAPAPPLQMDTLLTMPPFEEADGTAAADEAPAASRVGANPAELEPSAAANESEPASTRSSRAEARAFERARSLAITNATTEELNRYELAKLRGDPRALDEITSEALRAILAEQDGDDYPASDAD